jgi:alpha-galactosidase
MSLRDILAPTPPMGWNSWDSFGMTVTEGEIEATASFMASHLLPHGWQFVVIDGGWSMPGRTTPVAGSGAIVPHDIDAHGRFIPALDRFPSAANGVGFRAIADYLHQRGLKFGIHIMRGIPREAVAANTPVLGTRYRARDIANTSDTCSWSTEMYGLDLSHPGAQAYYESIVDLYNDWHVDFIKADDMTAPYHRRDIEAFSHALRGVERREIVLSLSPGNKAFDDKDILHALAHSELWRFSPDFWDHWDGGPKHFTTLKGQFELCKRAAAYTGPGHWSDADMLPVGRIGPRPAEGSDRPTRFSKDEQLTMMTLWLITRSPLMLGGHLPSLDAWTLDLLTNDEALSVNQRSWGNRVFSDEGEAIVWMANGPEGRLYLALFNLSDAPRTVEVPLHFAAADRNLRDLWARRDLGTVESTLSRALPPHGSALLQLW